MKLKCKLSKKTRLIIMMTFTLGFFFTEIVVGELSGSNALKADAFHMLSDVLALFVAFVSVYVSPKNWSRNTFGFARAEVLGALTNSVFLIALCFSIFTDSLKRFIDQEPIEDVDLVLGVGAAGLAINIVGLLLFHDHGHSHGEAGGEEERPRELRGEEGHHEHGPQKHDHDNDHHDHRHHRGNTTDSDNDSSLPGRRRMHTSMLHTSKTSHPGHHEMQMNIRGVFLHILADALGSVIVIISAIVYKYSSDWDLRNYVDPTLSIILVLLIVCATWPLLKDSAFILLQTVPSNIEMSDVKERLIHEVPEIEQIHEFHIWQLVATRVVASVHVKMSRNVPKERHMKYAERIKSFFHHEGIHATTVQVEYKEEQQQVNKKGCSVPCPRGNASTKCSEAPLPERLTKKETKASAASSIDFPPPGFSHKWRKERRTLSEKTQLASSPQPVSPKTLRKKIIFQSSVP